MDKGALAAITQRKDVKTSTATSDATDDWTSSLGITKNTDKVHISRDAREVHLPARKMKDKPQAIIACVDCKPAGDDREGEGKGCPDPILLSPMPWPARDATGAAAWIKPNPDLPRPS